MSALGGACRLAAGPDPKTACRQILAAQAVFGPHGLGFWDGGEASLGRHLFRTLPEDQFDNQPIVGGGGRFVLVADVRLDNRGELEGEFGLPSSDRRETCDAALVLAAWERWGALAMDHLVGAYAFALWDNEARSLSLVRDPLGQRPLFFSQGGGRVAFSSMPRGLLVLPEVARAPDELWLRDFLALLPERGERTCYSGISRVEPGRLVTFSPSGVLRSRFWNPRPKPIRLRSEPAYVEALNAHLEVAVSAMLRGGGATVGAELSSGLDSTAVATTAARLQARMHGEIVAFTAVPREGYVTLGTGLVDEGPLAAATAAFHPNMRHVLVRPPKRALTEVMEADGGCFDRPLWNLCNTPWIHEIYRQARDQGATVLLTGEAGNLTLSYGGLDALPEHLAGGRLFSWLRLANQTVKGGARRWRGVAYHSLGPWIPGPVWARLERLRMGFSSGLEGYSALHPDQFASLDYVRRCPELGMDPFGRPSRDSFTDRVNMLTRSDFGAFHTGTLGAWGVDCRDPTSDLRLVEFCLNIPTEQFMAGGRPRSLARRLLVGQAPEIVINEPKRGWQGADWHERASLGVSQMKALVARLETCGAAARLLDLARMSKLLDHWPEDSWETDHVVENYRSALLRGLAVGHFLCQASSADS